MNDLKPIDCSIKDNIVVWNKEYKCNTCGKTSVGGLNFFGEEFKRKAHFCLHCLMDFYLKNGIGELEEIEDENDK